MKKTITMLLLMLGAICAQAQTIYTYNYSTNSVFKEFCNQFQDRVDLHEYLNQHTLENNMALDGSEYNFSGIKTVKDIYCNTLRLDSLLIKHPTYTKWNENHPISHKLTLMFKEEKFKYYKESLESVHFAITNGVYFEIVSELKKDLQNKTLSIEDIQMILYVSNTLYYDYIISEERIKC